MKIIYDPAKAKKLLIEREIDLKEIADLLLTTGPLDIIEHPARTGQRIFLLLYKDYIHAVPFVRDNSGNYVLKTAYKSRKYNKIYGGRNET